MSDRDQTSPYFSPVNDEHHRADQKLCGGTQAQSADGHWTSCSSGSNTSAASGGHADTGAMGDSQSLQPDAGEDAPANDRRAVENEAIGSVELETAVGRFRERKAAHGELVADDLVDLSAAYSIAEARAEADRKTRVKRPYLQNADYFSWHLRSIAGEFALPSHESDSTLQWRAFEAHELVTSYPEWVDAIRAGRVRLQHARAFLRDTRALDAEHMPLLAERALKFAETHTVSETHHFVEREVSTLAAENFEAAHAVALEDRHVVITHEGLGMSTIHATVATELAIGIDKQLTLDAQTIQNGNKLDASTHTAAVQAARAAGFEPPTDFTPDKRTVAQIRADVFAEMLLCGDPESIARAETAGASRVSASVNVVVPVLSVDRKSVV